MCEPSNFYPPSCDQTDMRDHPTDPAHTLNRVQRSSLRVAAAVVLVCALLTTGCAMGYEYDDARDAYASTAEDRAAAAKRLRSEAAKLEVGELGEPVRSSSAECEAGPQTTIGGTDTVSCDVDLWLVYTGEPDGTAPDTVWAAEKTAVRALVAGLDAAGWREAQWGPQLEQSMADPSYNPYPLYNGTAAKEPVDVNLHLTDRHTHRQYPESSFFRTPSTFRPSDDAPFKVAVQFRYTYLVEASCEDCYDKSPTSWPTR